MNGFAYSIQTETASRRRESRSRGICLPKVFIKKGMELSVNSVSKDCYGAADSYKLSFHVLSQFSTSFPAIDLYRNVAVQKRIRQALNSLEELNPSAFNLVRLKSGTDEDYVSVNRMDYWEPSYENCRKYRPRIEGDRIAGYAKLTAGDVRRSHVLAVGILSISIWPCS